VLENLRPLATEFDNRKGEVNKVIEPLAENYLRLNALGSYGAYFNYYICATTLKFNVTNCASTRITSPSSTSIFLEVPIPPASCINR